LVNLVGQGFFDIALSVPLVLEYEDACKRIPFNLRPDDNAVDDVLDYFCSVAQSIKHIHFLWRPLLRDPHDDLVVELAVAGGCSTIVTFNKRDFKGVERFGISLFTPREYLTRLEIR
jgi:predicted nucleic acid-binding protein